MLNPATAQLSVALLVSTKHMKKSHMVSLGYAHYAQITISNPTKETMDVLPVKDVSQSTTV